MLSILPALWVAVAALSACTGSPDNQLADVRELHSTGEFDASIAPLRTILQRDPNMPEANYLLGLALVQTGKPVLAVIPLRKASEDPDIGVAAGTLLAAVLSSRQQHQAAAVAAGNVIERDPDNVLALQVRAASYLRAGKNEDALVDARRAVEISPGALQARVLEAVALDRLGRRDEAAVAEGQLAEAAREAGERTAEIRSCVMIALFHHELGESDRSRATIDDCLDRFPSEPFVLQQAATLYDSAGESAEATRLWQEAVERNPDQKVLYSLLAERLIRQGRAADAESVLSAAAERFADATSLLQLARFHQRRGDVPTASAILDRAVEAAGEPNEELLVTRTELLIDSGDLVAAEASIEELGTPLFRDLLRGRLLLARGQDSEALEAFEAGIARAPFHPNARFLAGTTAERLGLIERAIFHYREATANDPGASDAPVALARLLLARGQAAEAAAHVSVALTARPAAASRVLVIGARAQAQLGNLEAARAYLDTLEGLPGQRPRVLLERAKLASRSDGHAEAVRLIEESEFDLTDPSRIDLLRMLANGLTQLGRESEALRRFDEAIERSPDSAGLHDGRARVLYGMGRHDEARAAFREALRLSPDYASALTGLGKLAAAEGNVEEAIALLDRSNAGNIRDPDGALLAAQLVEAQGHGEEAEDRLRGILRAFPDHADTLNQLAWTLATQKRELDTALDLAERAARLEPLPEILDTLGWVRLQRGEAALAIPSFERALSVTPDAASTRYRLGLALAEIGRSDEARAAFERALGDDKLPEADQARAALAQLGAS